MQEQNKIKPYVGRDPRGITIILELGKKLNHKVGDAVIVMTTPVVLVLQEELNGLAENCGSIKGHCTKLFSSYDLRDKKRYL